MFREYDIPGERSAVQLGMRTRIHEEQVIEILLIRVIHRIGFQLNKVPVVAAVIFLDGAVFIGDHLGSDRDIRIPYCG